MTDRFKFRVWNSSANAYVPRSQFILLSDGTLIQEIGGEEVIWESTEPEFCTGLKDKNGKLIYEGDILGGIYGGYISWCDECKSFELFVPEYGCASCSGDVLWQEIVEDDGMLEIIGNIHENADLLE